MFQQLVMDGWNGIAKCTCLPGCSRCLRLLSKWMVVIPDIKSNEFIVGRIWF